LRAIERALLLAFFSGVETGLLASLEDGKAGGVFFFGLGMGREGTGKTFFFGTGFADAGIGALFFGTVWGEDGAEAGVGGGLESPSCCLLQVQPKEEKLM